VEFIVGFVAVYFLFRFARKRSVAIAILVATLLIVTACCGFTNLLAIELGVFFFGVIACVLISPFWAIATLIQPSQDTPLPPPLVKSRGPWDKR
jgi:hypothetical protein